MHTIRSRRLVRQLCWQCYEPAVQRPGSLPVSPYCDLVSRCTLAVQTILNSHKAPAMFSRSGYEYCCAVCEAHNAYPRELNVRRMPSFTRIVLCDRSSFPKLQINKSPVVGHPTDR